MEEEEVMGMMTETNPIAREPERVRAVFSTEDFGLLRVAVAHYLSTAKDAPDARKYGNLYHRLGRLS
jgi:hypothetical protein